MQICRGFIFLLYLMIHSTAGAFSFSDTSQQESETEAVTRIQLLEAQQMEKAARLTPARAPNAEESFDKYFGCSESRSG